jgi:hypothetical protein
MKRKRRGLQSSMLSLEEVVRRRIFVDMNPPKVLKVEKPNRWGRIDRELEQIEEGLDALLAKVVAAGWNPDTRTWSKP